MKGSKSEKIRNVYGGDLVFVSVWIEGTVSVHCKLKVDVGNCRTIDDSTSGKCENYFHVTNFITGWLRWRKCNVSSYSFPSLIESPQTVHVMINFPMLYIKLS